MVDVVGPDPVTRCGQSADLFPGQVPVLDRIEGEVELGDHPASLEERQDRLDPVVRSVVEADDHRPFGERRPLVPVRGEIARQDRRVPVEEEPVELGGEGRRQDVIGREPALPRRRPARIVRRDRLDAVVVEDRHRRRRIGGRHDRDRRHGRGMGDGRHRRRRRPLRRRDPHDGRRVRLDRTGARGDRGRGDATVRERVRDAPERHGRDRDQGHAPAGEAGSFDRPASCRRPHSILTSSPEAFASTAWLPWVRSGRGTWRRRIRPPRRHGRHGGRTLAGRASRSVRIVSRPWSSASHDFR